jgi:hypothetical protein
MNSARTPTCCHDDEESRLGQCGPHTGETSGELGRSESPVDCAKASVGPHGKLAGLGSLGAKKGNGTGRFWI